MKRLKLEKDFLEELYGEMDEFGMLNTETIFITNTIPEEHKNDDDWTSEFFVSTLGFALDMKEYSMKKGFYLSSGYNPDKTNDDNKFKCSIHNGDDYFEHLEWKAVYLAVKNIRENK